MDTLCLIKQIRDYEPDIIDIIFNFVFIKCHEDREGKYRYGIVFPKSGTTCIDKDSFYKNKVLK